jgi:RNA polymerase sigma-70 factor, ECF subfamily
MKPELAAGLREVFAAEWPRVVGATLRAFGDLELAEDSAQEAFLRAHERLAAGETIRNLGAWATTSARRIAIDALRRDTVLRSKLPLLIPDALAAEDDPAAAADDPATARLDLIFVACHPVLSEEQQIAIALRIVCGIPTTDIADFFEQPEATIAARLTRARKAISNAEVAFEWPSERDKSARLGHVLTTIYGIYTLGHTAPRGSVLTDARLTQLALELTEALCVEHPDNSEVLGLRALILLGEARQSARVGDDGVPMTLAEVDRSAWGQQRIQAGLDLAAKALPGGGRFALQAGIAGLHCSARRWEDTDWSAIATLYSGLVRVWPAPVVRLGSVIANSHRGQRELDNAAHALERMLEGASGEFRRRVSAAVADVEERRGRIPAARDAIADALAGERNAALVRYFTQADARLAALQGGA